jgi:hypothetical protein
MYLYGAGALAPVTIPAGKVFGVLRLRNLADPDACTFPHECGPFRPQWRVDVVILCRKPRMLFANYLYTAITRS